MVENAIFAEGLARSFEGREVVKGIDLRIPEGAVYGFLGPNGAGKSTTVRMLVTLLMPSAGSASVAGWDVISNPLQVRLKIGVALQEAGLDPKQTGRELLILHGRLYGLSSSHIKRRITELESLIDIGEAMDRLIGTYSGGMKRRIDLAAALLHRPEVLFLDEPTTGLDPSSRAQVWEQVRTINRQQGVTVFLTTHYLEEADALADTVGIINNGKIVDEGSPAKLKRSVGADVILVKLSDKTDLAKEAVSKLDDVISVEDYGNEISISVSNAAALISGVVSALNSAQVSVDEITLRTPTLDDVFLARTGARLSVLPNTPREKNDKE